MEIFGILYSNMPKGTFRLGTALENVQGEEFREKAKKWQDQAKLARMIKKERRRYLDGWPIIPPNYPKGTPIWIQQTLIQNLIRDGKTIQPNDVVDLMHAVVPLRFAHILVLDKAWANFAKKLNLDDTEIFAVGDLEKALDLVRSMDVSRYRVFRPEVPHFIRADR